MAKPQPKQGTLHAKLRLVRKFQRPSLSQDEMAKRLGVSRSLVSRYETDDEREIPLDYIQTVVARFPQWTIEWFYDGKEGLPVELTGPGAAPPGGNPPPGAAPGVGRRLFPLVGSAGAAQFPIRSEQGFVDDVVEFSEDLYRSERFVIQVQGDSMIPRIHHRDYILVQPDQNPPLGLIVVAQGEEYEYSVKVLRETEDGTKELHPINPEFRVIRPGKGWRVIGYAVGLRRERGKGSYLEEGDNAGLRPENERS